MAVVLVVALSFVAAGRAHGSEGRRSPLCRVVLAFVAGFGRARRDVAPVVEASFFRSKDDPPRWWRGRPAAASLGRGRVVEGIGAAAAVVVV
eukprot:CAMPEP_0201203456 /NCGR_PEP_ID=MMETSP0851-20130426/167117_1 /ASSEMBLY_ACC=CAM_ASM_000631 /TAXON_ID=183588 /ORGANISM="Pseudo-nitzschia fraudulenta, Strain WWA7" /LENGTH=91 /DNA_ID=CAMNT_0047491443 /DNA_START=11 /DNA_END=283 /DNA_ORIENTATION=-